MSDYPTSYRKSASRVVRGMPLPSYQGVAANNNTRPLPTLVSDNPNPVKPAPSKVRKATVSTFGRKSYVPALPGAGIYARAAARVVPYLGTAILLYEAADLYRRYNETEIVEVPIYTGNPIDFDLSAWTPNSYFGYSDWKAAQTEPQTIWRQAPYPNSFGYDLAVNAPQVQVRDFTAHFAESTQIIQAEQWAGTDVATEWMLTNRPGVGPLYKQGLSFTRPVGAPDPAFVGDTVTTVVTRSGIRLHPAPANTPLPYRSIPGLQPDPIAPNGFRRESGYSLPNVGPSLRPEPTLRPIRFVFTPGAPSPGVGVNPVTPGTTQPVPGQKPGTNSNPKPNSPPRNDRPPGKGTKERKGQQMAFVRSVFTRLNAVTEANDILVAAWEALPDKYRSGYYKLRKKGGGVYYAKRWHPHPGQMMNDLYRHSDQIDLTKLVYNIAANHLEDAFFGGTSQQLAKASKPWLNLSKRPVGFQTGLAL